MSTNTQRIYKNIRRRILVGEYPPNAMLSETKLVAEFGSSRPVISQAVSLLEKDGIVEIVPRQGIQVISILGDYEALKSNLTTLFFVNAWCVSELTKDQTRLSKAVCSLDRVHSNMVSILENQQQNDPQETVIRFVDAELDFHRAIVVFAGFGSLLSTVRQIQHKIISSIPSSEYPKSWCEILTDHKSILSAIKNSDHDAALGAMKLHFLNETRSWFPYLESSFSNFPATINDLARFFVKHEPQAG